MQTDIIISKFWNRVFALLIDAIILGLVGWLISLFMIDFLVRIGSYGALIGMAIAVLYQTIGNSKFMNGQTIGKQAMGIEVVDYNGNTIGIGKSFLRALILNVPYFLSKVQFYDVTGVNILGMIATGIIFTMSTGVIVLYIFNKETRQSLHDLAVGTYVVSCRRGDEQANLPAISKTPFYVWGGIMTLFLLLDIYGYCQNNPQLNKAISLYQKISGINGVLKASVLDNTSYSGNSKFHYYQVQLWLPQMPDVNLQNSPPVREAVKLVLDNISNNDSIQSIEVTVTKEFNIGIAFGKTSSSIGKSPDDWRAILR